MIAQEPPPRPGPTPEPVLAPPRLVVLAIGTGQFESHDPVAPRIPYALEDARDVAAFLAAPLGRTRFQDVEVQTLLGPDATAERIDQAFRKLDERRHKGDLGQGDSIFVLIESHLLGLDRTSPGMILTTDSGHGTPPARRSRPTRSPRSSANWPSMAARCCSWSMACTRSGPRLPRVLGR